MHVFQSLKRKQTKVDIEQTSLPSFTSQFSIFVGWSNKIADSARKKSFTQLTTNTSFFFLYFIIFFSITFTHPIYLPIFFCLFFKAVFLFLFPLSILPTLKAKCPLFILRFVFCLSLHCVTGKGYCFAIQYQPNIVSLFKKKDPHHKKKSLSLYEVYFANVSSAIILQFLKKNSLKNNLLNHVLFIDFFINNCR